MKGDIYSNTIIVGFNTPLTSVDRSSRQKTTKATEVLNYTIYQLKLIDIQLRKKKKRLEYPFIPIALETLSGMDHILGQKTSLSNFKIIEIISSILSDRNSIKLRISHRTKNWKRTTTWRLNSVSE